LGKRGQSHFWIDIKPSFQPTESPSRILHKNSRKLQRNNDPPRVELAESQYEQLNELREKTDKLVSEMICEAVSWFVEKRDHPVGIISSYLPKASRDNYRTVTVYFPGSDLGLLASISKETRKM